MTAFRFGALLPENDELPIFVGQIAIGNGGNKIDV
jgi:hypothetical protein